MICVLKIVIIVGKPLPKEVSHRASFEKEQTSTMSSGAGKRDELAAVAGPSSSGESPKIFKLTIDCFDEIFEYLSKICSFLCRCKEFIISAFLIIFQFVLNSHYFFFLFMNSPPGICQ